jgi:hypothetical protein
LSSSTVVTAAPAAAVASVTANPAAVTVAAADAAAFVAAVYANLAAVAANTAF